MTEINCFPMKRPISILFSLTLFLVSCVPGTAPESSLSEAYSDHFPIGAAISGRHLESYDTVLLKQHFTSITAENDMKPSNTLGENMEFTFEAGDRIADFALRNGMLVRGHTLVWYNQTPDWFFRDTAGALLPKEVMLERLEKYIQRVLDHYRGRVYAWDVVNEAIAGGDGFYREEIDWFRICGPDYIEKAFLFAREADPEVKLFYNDYNLIDPVKSRKVYEMAKDFQERGIPIDGIGMQGHWTLEDVNEKNLARSIDLFASLGLEVQITELDLSIYPFYHSIPGDSLPQDPVEFTAELEGKQAEKYREIFRVLREKSDVVTSVTFWGVADNRTWLSNYFVRGRTDHPLLFDAEYREKESFESILDF